MRKRAARRAQDPDKHKEVNGLLGDIADNRFADLVALGKHITDFSPDAGGEDAANGGAPGDLLDDDIGVAVEFEGDEDDDEDEDVAELVVSFGWRWWLAFPTCAWLRRWFSGADGWRTCLCLGSGAG